MLIYYNNIYYTNLCMVESLIRNTAIIRALFTFWFHPSRSPWPWDWERWRSEWSPSAPGTGARSPTHGNPHSPSSTPAGSRALQTDKIRQGYNPYSRSLVNHHDFWKLFETFVKKFRNFCRKNVKHLCQSLKLLWQCLNISIMIFLLQRITIFLQANFARISNIALCLLSLTKTTKRKRHFFFIVFKKMICETLKPHNNEHLSACFVVLSYQICTVKHDYNKVPVTVNLVSI